MTPESLVELREQVAALTRRLALGLTEAERLEVKRDIFVVHKALEGHAAAVAALQADVLELVRRWKDAHPTNAPEFAAARPVVHADHIGASTFIEKGWSRLSLGDHEGAEQALRHALALSPGDLQATGLLGWAQMLQEQYDEALTQFGVVLTREPTNALARVNLGYIGLRQGRLAEAVEHLSKAIRLDSDRKATLYANFYLGLVYLERGLSGEAQVFLRKALALGPNLIEAQYALGFALWLNDERDAALSAWATGAEVGRFSPWGARCAAAHETAHSGATPVRAR